MARDWRIPGETTRKAAERLATRHGVPRPVAYAMVRRGLEDETERDAFLNPRLRSLGDPMVLPQVGRGAERVWRAIDREEPIFLHGDYDVDGLTGTAFLARTLGALGAATVPFVPSREEGYGLGPAGVAAAREAGAGVCITVDCGTTAFEEIRELQEGGIDVVVLDHHEPAAELPPATAVVNPRWGETGQAYATLAAVGVAAKFLHAMASLRPGALPPEAYREALQLVALGTIADVVPLVGENRILVSYGLKRLSRSRWTGIQALKAVARLTRDRVSATDVAFFLAPRINAVGRMGNARDALALLLTDDPVEAYRRADQVEAANRERREADRLVVAEALEQLRGREPLPAILVLWSERWPAGVVGIAASRLQERFHRPVCVIALEGDHGRGSARSAAAFPLPRALEACEDLLEAHGGHARAAGFSIRRQHLETFRDRMESLGAASELAAEATPWDLDATVSLEEIDAPCLDWLERLEPYGSGNPEPLFGGEGFLLAEAPSVVGRRHLRLSFRGAGAPVRAIAFNQGERVKEFGRGQRVDAVFHAGFDTWRGGRTPQLIVRDLRLGASR